MFLGHNIQKRAYSSGSLMTAGSRSSSSSSLSSSSASSSGSRGGTVLPVAAKLSQLETFIGVYRVHVGLLRMSAHPMDR